MPNVFLVDDDPTFVDLACRRLQQDGHAVEYNEGAFGVLKAFRRKQYVVILIDVNMPYIDGPKLVELMRIRGIGRARIVFISAIGEKELKRAASAHGIETYFCKGWGLDRLAQLVGSA